jgi:hypothetical protein
LRNTGVNGHQLKETDVIFHRHLHTSPELYSRIYKVKIYKTVLKSCVIYGAELWTLAKKDEKVMA